MMSVATLGAEEDAPPLTKQRVDPFTRSILKTSCQDFSRMNDEYVQKIGCKFSRASGPANFTWARADTSTKQAGEGNK